MIPMGPIILSKEQFKALSALLVHPDPAYMEQRDAVFARADSEIMITRIGQDMEVEIPGLELGGIT